MLSPEAGYGLALLHEDALKVEMRQVCTQFPKDELFFAARMWTPGAIAANGLSFGEDGMHALVPRHETATT